MLQDIDKRTAIIIKYYSDNRKIITEKYYELIKWIGASSLAFLPFFVSLIPRSPLCGWLLGLYISVVISVGLGLLAVCVLLFGQLRLDNLLLIQATTALSTPPDQKDNYTLSQVKLPVYYKVAKNIFLISYIIFFLSFISFCVLIAI